MQFSFRAAIIIVAFCAASFAGAGTPGFAIEPDKSVLQLQAPPQTQPQSLPSVLLNVALPAIVPATAPPSPAVTTAPSAISDATESESQRHFETLAAAVAAQDVPESADSDLMCLAGAIYFEAKGEPLSGQLAVAQVVLNRTESGRFPRSICSVVKQRGQFSFVRAGQLPSVSMRNASYRTAMAIAQIAIDKTWDSEAANALFFHAHRVAPAWRLTRVASIGNHVFYR